MRSNNAESRGRSRDDSSGEKKKNYRSREEMPPQEFRKYRDASKSEKGWTKADGKPLRKRLDKDAKSSSSPPRRDGDKPFTKKSFSSDRGPSRKPVFDKERSSRPDSFSKDRSIGGEERGSFREKSFDRDNDRTSRPPSDRERPARSNTYSKNRPARSDDRGSSKEKSFKSYRSDSKGEERKPYKEKSYGSDKKKTEDQPFGKFYKEKRSFTKNKKARADGFSNPSEKRYSDRPASKFDSREKRPYVKKEYKPRAERPQTTESFTTQTEGVRLNRFIANSGICSRREADELIEAGVISVNGKVVTELGTRVSADDDIRYNGERMKSEKLVYLILNKPKDYITTTDDPQERKTVMELVKSAGKERIYPVGRLDRNTTGLLMFTNDGEMTKKLTHPASNIFKVYHLELDKPLTHEHLHTIAEGVELEDGFIKVDEIAYDDEGAGDKRMVGVELHSGKNRVVRRLFEHFEYEVRRLDRVIFAGLTKKDLPRGRWRFLTEEEISMLKVMTGAGKKKA